MCCIGVGVFQWLISVRSGRLKRSLLVLVLSANLYALVDLTHYWDHLRHFGIEHSLLRLLYVVALNGIALGGLCRAVLLPAAR